MPRETAEAKGMRYLVEHRLTIVEVNADRVRAVARGGGEVYDLGLDGSDWWCTCECRTRACSHLHALRAVVTRRRTDG